MLGGEEGAWIIKTFIDCVEESQLYHEGTGELWKILGEGGPWSSFLATLNPLATLPTKAGLSLQTTMVSLEHGHV